VLHRYLAASPIPGVQDWMLRLNFSWAQELCIIMFVWMCKFGAAYGVRTGIHVGVDVVVNRLEEGTRGRVVIFGLLAGALFTGTIGILGATFVWKNGAHYAFLRLFGLATGDYFEGPTTPDLEWPTWIVYLAIPLGSSLMCFRFLQVAWVFWKTGELPRHDPTHVEGMKDVPPLVGEALAEAEQRERAPTASPDEASDKERAHRPRRDDRKDGRDTP
jgi:C4-dicarboxylate transporter DctQ subunit